MTKPMLAVGIDPAKRLHRAIGVLYPDTVVLDVEFPNQIEACRDLDARLVALADQHGADLVYGLEDHRQYGRTIAQVLSELNRQIRVVNPLWTNRQRAFYGQDKDDAVDARCVAAVVLRRSENLPDARSAGELAAAIREAEQGLQHLAEQRTASLNRLHQHLCDVYTATYEDFFGKLKSPLSLRFFKRFPVPQELNGHNTDMLAGIMLDLASGRVGPHKGARRIEILQQKAVAILAATEAARALARTVAVELKAELIRQLCDELLDNHDRKLRLERLLRDQLLPASGQTITGIPGIGTIIAATIIGETADIGRFKSRDAFAKYNGTAPATNSTGGKQRHTARRACNHRLKRAFWLAARTAVMHDPLAEAYYQRCRQRGLSYTDAIKRVARKMSDIVYAMLKSGVAYDCHQLEAAIRERAQRREPAAVSGASVKRLRERNALATPDASRVKTQSKRGN
jgi:transposase